jgi:gliding motility-associated-like protein
VTPIFSIKNNYCIDVKAENLPTFSNNNLTGTWNPANIATFKAGNNKYTFTPTAGQCATNTSLDVTIDAKTLPLFTQVGPYCKKGKADTLSSVSTNGIKGIWSPSVISTLKSEDNVYTFTPNNNECAFSQEMQVSVVDKPILTATASPTRICLGDSTILTVNGAPNGATITWDNNAENGNDLIATPLKSGAYNVSVTLGSDCQSTALVYVRIECPQDFFAPTMFSPNGDNINDTFTIMGGKNIQEVVSLQVYDRWGEVIFQNNNFQPNQADKGWNGAFRGFDEQPGVYVYFTQILFKDGTTGTFKGEVVLYR